MYDQLSTGTYQGPWQVIVQSRRMMAINGNVSCWITGFIGWYILIGITLGIAGVIIYHLHHNLAEVLFYENLKSLSKSKMSGTKSVIP